MNTKGNTQLEARNGLRHADIGKTVDYVTKITPNRSKLLAAIHELSDEEAIALFNWLAESPHATPLSAPLSASTQTSPQMPATSSGNLGGEEAMYPLEFLNAMNETAFEALRDWLIRQQAPKAAVDLLEDLNILNTWKAEVEKGNGVVGKHVNMFLQDTVASLTLHVAEIGGVFYAPYGPTVRRDG